MYDLDLTPKAALGELPDPETISEEVYQEIINAKITLV